jgi:hypothetical protein
MPVALPGWFDDSERDDEKHAVAALGGCVGTESQWDVQDSAWVSDVLEPFGLTKEGFHTREFASFRGSYKQFKGNPERSRELSDAILGTFKKSQVRPFAAMTRLADLRRFNQERGRQISHYALNIYTCMSYVRRSFRRELTDDAFVQMNLDKSNSDTGTGPAIRLARLYANTHPEPPGAVNNVHVLPMKEGMAHCTPALQAADFVAGEARRFVEQWREFWEERPDGESSQDLRNALTKWSEETGRIASPFDRGSFRALMRGKPWATIHTWTFNSLCSYDDLRKGIWAP